MDQQDIKSSIDQIKADYLIFFQQWLANSGINPYIGRIMQLLRFENKPLTQSDMQIALNLSKATISRNLKVMEETNLLKIDIVASGEKTSDKFTYELKEKSLFFIMSKFMKRIHSSLIQRKDDNNLVLSKIEHLPENEKNDPDVLNLQQIINEELVIFDIMREKFEKMLQEFEADMLKKI